MYSEMLADGMVRDEESRRSYLETLRQESNRLAHLVENVLQYARLERSQPAGELERLRLAELVDRLRGRIESRAEQAGLQVDWRVDSQQLESSLRTDPTTIEQIVFNLVDNACKYARRAARRSLEVSLDCGLQQLRISVRDYGPGIAAADRGKMFRPFSRLAHRGAAPGVGLGLALCQRLAAQLGGTLQFVPHQPGAEFRLLLPLAD
jgi:signal transduction histidine kinase